MVGNGTAHDEAATTDTPHLKQFENVSPRTLNPYWKDPQKMDWLVFDIETTGRAWDDEVNMIGLRSVGSYAPNGRLENAETRVFYRSDTPTGDDNLTEAALEEMTDENVTAVPCDGERELLEETREAVVTELVGPSTIVTAYNGQTKGGGFDMKFLRQRAEQYRMPHPFKDTRFVDAFGAVSKADRLNTLDTSILGSPEFGNLTKAQVETFIEEYVPLPYPKEKGDHFGNKAAMTDWLYKVEEHISADIVALFAENELDGNQPLRAHNDLDSVYEQITETQVLDVDPTAYDPWSDSAKVLNAWEDGDMQSIALHNIADIVQTTRVMEMAVRQFDPYQLQPTWL